MVCPFDAVALVKNSTPLTTLTLADFDWPTRVSRVILWELIYLTLIVCGCLVSSATPITEATTT